MKILFIGESWRGSCARSLREALARRADIDLDDIAEEAWFPKPGARWLRAINRLTAWAYSKEFDAHVLNTVRSTQPDIVMTYKGNPVHAELVHAIRRAGAMTVNVYPDYSPHAYGDVHRRAMGAYDLVVSSKPYHPELWRSLYGYDNRCVFVPQGYDPALHLVPKPPVDCPSDVVMVGTYREQYGRLMIDFARALSDSRIAVAIGGNGWDAIRTELPSHWDLLGPVVGGRYVSTLRQGKICVAPLNRIVVIDGRRQPGDVDTTRTYELAAAHCFFVHQRTDYAQTVYDEETEVPMFDDGEELARQVQRYLAHPEARSEMAAAAHRRAVDAYSIDRRAGEIVAEIRKRTGTVG